MGGRGWVGSRPPVPISLHGDTAEVWAGETQVGLLFRWTVTGRNGKWDGDARKYLLMSFCGGVEVRFFVKVKGETIMELRGQGHIIEPFTADGETHLHRVVLKGTRLIVA